MSYRPARFTGRVRLQTGAAAVGCHVVLRVGDTPHIACETWTSSRGEFVLEVPPGRMPTGADAQGGFTLEVYDGTGSLLVRRGDLIARAGLNTHIAFTSPKRAMVTLPAALPLQRSHAGSIIRPEALAVIDAALGLLAPVGTEAHARYARAARRTLPPAGHVDELIDLAWSALDGDPRAMEDLREVLAVQAAAVRKDVPLAPSREDEPRKRSKYAYGLPKDPAPVGPKVDPATITGRLLSSPPARRLDDEELARATAESAVDTDRILPLLIATVRISRNAGERIAFFDGLHGLLSGLSTIDRLYRASLEVLQDRRIAPLRAQLALLMGDVEADDGSSSPLPMPGGVRSPGADPSLPALVGPWWERLQHAVREAKLALEPQHEAEEPMVHLESIEPAHAPPGTVVTLRGHGFGNHGGEVVFDGAAPVEAVAWSDTEVRVEVPPDARPGPVNLRVLQCVLKVGRKLVEVYREGHEVVFEGGVPRIRSVLVDGHGEGAWVRPGDAVTVSWMTVGGTDGRVSLYVRVAGKGERDLVLFAEDDLPTTGSRILAVPDADEEHELVVEAAVTNRVTSVRRTFTWPVAVPPKLRIEGIEVTQGVQVAPWEKGEPVPTVAGKDTIARVYVSADREGFHDDRARVVHAVLRVGDVALSPLEIRDRDETPEAFEAGRAHAIDRSRNDHALVFRIPAPLCSGTKELHCEVYGAGRPPDVPKAEARLTWTWTTVRPVPVRYVRVDGGDGGPDDATARFTVLRAFDLLPTPPDDVGPAWCPRWVAGEGEDDPARVLDDIADLHDPSTWEWLSSTVGSLSPADEDAIWVGVTRDAEEHAPDRRTALAPGFVAKDGPDAPARVAGARALARVLEGSAADAGEAPARVAEVPFDPYFTTTVVDPRHGVRDLATPPVRGWIASQRWRRLIERA